MACVAKAPCRRAPEPFGPRSRDRRRSPSRYSRCPDCAPRPRSRPGPRRERSTSPATVGLAGGVSLKRASMRYVVSHSTLGVTQLRCPRSPAPRYPHRFRGAPRSCAPRYPHRFHCEPRSHAPSYALPTSPSDPITTRSHAPRGNAVFDAPRRQFRKAHAGFRGDGGIFPKGARVKSQGRSPLEPLQTPV